MRWRLPGKDTLLGAREQGAPLRSSRSAELQSTGRNRHAPKTSRPRDLESTRDMKTLLNIRHAFQRTRRRAIWSVASASALPVALLIALTTCSSPTVCAMGRVAGQANAADSQRA